MALTMKELQEMEPGDFLVHVDFGIGKFAGLVRVPAGDSLSRDDTFLSTNITTLLMYLFTRFIRLVSIVVVIVANHHDCLFLVQVLGTD